MNSIKDKLRKKQEKQKQQKENVVMENYANASELILTGSRLYNAGQYAEAFNSFKTSYDLHQTLLNTFSSEASSEISKEIISKIKGHSHVLLESMSKCQEMLGNDIQAEDLLNQAYKQNRRETENLLLEFYQRKNNIEKIYQLLKNRHPEYLLKVCGIELLSKIADYVFMNKKNPTSQQHALNYSKLVVATAETSDKKISTEQILSYKNTLAKIYLTKNNYQACYETYRNMTTLSQDYYQHLARLVGEYGEKINRPQSETEFYWQKLSHEHNNPEGTFDYAYMLTEGGADFKRDYQKAAELFTGLVTKGHPKAAHELGIIYTLGGDGIEPNIDLAIKYYRESINKFNNGISKNNLGILLLKLKRHEEALELLQEAAEEDFAESQVSLGLMYYDGIGVEQNREIAFMWYLKALAQGNTIALCNLIVLLSTIILNANKEDLAHVESLYKQTKDAVLQAIKAGNKSLERVVFYFELLENIRKNKGNELAKLENNTDSNTGKNEGKEVSAESTSSKESEPSDTEQLAKLKHKEPNVTHKEFADVRANLNLTAEQQVKMICAAVTTSKVKLVSLTTALLYIGQITNKSNSAPINKNITGDIVFLLRSLMHALGNCSEINLGWLSPALTGLGLLQWHNTNNLIDALQSIIAEKIIQESAPIKLGTACMLFVGFTRLKLTAKGHSSIDLLANRIKASIGELNLRLLGNVLFASAVMSANGKSFDFIGVVLSEILKRINVNNVAYFDPIFVNQVSLAARYFARLYPQQTIAIMKLLGPIVNQNMEAESHSNIVNMSYFQRRFTRFLGVYYSELKVEQSINGLLVDIVLPNNIIIQINGPKHYFHDMEPNSPAAPLPTPIENFHNKLLENQTVVHIPYFEADLLTTPADIYTYINNKLPADKKLSPFDPRKHQPTLTTFGLSTSASAASNSNVGVDDDDNDVEHEGYECN